MTADWGESWASYPNFDLCLDQLIEKSNRLSKFLSERAQAQIDYAKKLREIAQKHQQKYNLIHAKHEKSKNNQHTSHIAFLSILSQTISTANKNESNGKEILNLTNSKLNNCERKSGEKRNNLNNENQRLKNKLQEQQRRVETSKTENQKRKREQEKAAQNYKKFKEKPEGNSNIIELDRLRVLSLDKDALASRSQEEYDRQVKEYKNAKDKYYKKDLRKESNL